MLKLYKNIQITRQWIPFTFVPKNFNCDNSVYCINPKNCFYVIVKGMENLKFKNFKMFDRVVFKKKFFLTKPVSIEYPCIE